MGLWIAQFSFLFSYLFLLGLLLNQSPPFYPLLAPPTGKREAMLEMLLHHQIW